MCSTSGREERRPIFATGKVVGDYGLLFKYWDVAGREKAEKAMLTNKDFEKLRELVEGNPGMSLARLLDVLTEYFIERVDPEAARKAYKEYYGVDVDTYTARRQVARLLAGWLIEAGENWKILSLHGYLPP